VEVNIRGNIQRVRAPDVNVPRWATSTADVLVATYASWRDARTIRLGAGIAYYALFAIVPLITLSIWLAGVLVDDQAVDDFFQKVGAGLNIETDAVSSFSETVGQSSTQNGLGLIGLVSLLFAAAVVFSALQDAFDEMWELPVTRGVRKKIRRRIKAFLVVGGGGIIIVVALVINAVSGLLEKLIPGQDTVLDRLPDLFSFVSGWVVLIGALAIMFQVLTTEKIHLSALAIGSLVTASLLSIGTQLLNWYLSNYASTSVGGALSSLFLALLWLYSVAQIVLAGGHLIRVLGQRRVEALAQAGSV
jgi:membrane protein